MCSDIASPPAMFRANQGSKVMSKQNKAPAQKLSL